MKKQMIRRCPWCGHEIDELKLLNQMLKKCSHCDHQYIEIDSEFGEEHRLHNIRMALLALSLVSAFLLVYSPLFIFLSQTLMIAFSLIKSMQTNHRRDNDKDIFTYKKYTADITFTEKLSTRQKKKYLSTCNVIPVCFVNAENIPVSHTICIYIENAAVISENKYECTFSFLPLSEVKFAISETGIRFYLFDDKLKIAEGVVTGRKDAF